MLCDTNIIYLRQGVFVIEIKLQKVVPGGIALPCIKSSLTT